MPGKKEDCNGQWIWIIIIILIIILFIPGIIVFEKPEKSV